MMWLLSADVGHLEIYKARPCEIDIGLAHRVPMYFDDLRVLITEKHPTEIEINSLPLILITSSAMSPFKGPLTSVGRQVYKRLLILLTRTK
jgi:hypothetical protein